MKKISISAILIFLFLCSCEQNLSKNEYSDAPVVSEEYPNPTFGVLTSARVAALDDDVLFCFNGKKYTIWFEGSTFEEVQEQVSTLALEDKEEEYFLEYLKKAGKSVLIILSKTRIEEIAPALNKHTFNQSLRSDRMNVVVFSYGCCKPDVMLPEIKILEEYYSEVINTIQVDSKIEHELADRFRVKVNPTILVFDEKARLQGRFLYHHSADEIFNIINEIREEKNDAIKKSRSAINHHLLFCIFLHKKAIQYHRCKA